MARELKQYIIKAKSKDVLDTLISDVIGMGIKIEHVYRHVFPGFSAPLTDLYVKSISNDPRIEYIEESVEFTNFVKQENAPWHLDRIDQRVLPLSGTYTYDSDGSTVIAYTLDSGCVFFNSNKAPSDTANFDHIEFGDRVNPVKDIDNSGVPIPNTVFDPIYTRLQLTDPNNGRLSSPRGFDHFGHGTHVAGLIGSETYGVAKNVEIRPAKVLDVFGGGILVDVVAGIEAIIGDYIHNSGGKSAVCNMSLGTNAPLAPAPAGSFELAVQALIDIGVTVVVAAGNSAQDANNTSPARMPDVITVGATGRVVDEQGNVIGDTIANFSNFGDSEDLISDETFGFNESVATNIGSVLDVFAPGVGITSTYKSSPTAVATFSGTSMAAPIVAGVVALVLQNNPLLPPIDVSDVIITNTIEGIIDGIPVGTPNRMLFSTFVDHVITWITPAGDLGSFPEGFTLNPEIRLVAVGFSGVPLTYSNPTGGLPPGITLNAATGVLEGIAPTVLVDTAFNFDIKVTDPSGFVVRSFSLTVLDGMLPPNWLTNSNLSSVEEGETLDIQLVALSRSLPITPVTYSVVDDTGNPSTMPQGWNLSTDGKITGLVPIVINDDLLVKFIVRATDGAVFIDREFSLLILQSSFVEPPVWQTNVNLGEIVKGDEVSIFLLATDADENPLPIKYKLIVESAGGSILGGEFNLPQGLSLDEDTGEITGSFTGNVTDGMLINPLLFDGGLTTFDNNTTTLETNEAIFEFQVFAVDGSMIVGRLFTLRIFNATPNKIIEWRTPSSSLGIAKSFEFSSFEVVAVDPDNGPNPISYTLDFGVLPIGLFLGRSTGIISGVPNNITEPSLNFIFGIAASDGSDSITRSFSITVERVNRQPLWITPPGLLIPSINEGQEFAFQLEAEDPNDTDDLSYSVINNITNFVLFDNNTTTFDGNTTTISDQQIDGSLLPPGLVLDADTGVISGNISNVDGDTTFQFTIRVDDSNSNPEDKVLFDDRQFSINVIDGNLNLNQAPVWITPSGALDEGTESELYRFELLAEDSDGPQPLSFILIAGELPTGLAVNTDSGVISGFPADSDTEDTTFPFSIRIQDGALFTDRFFTIKILDTTIGNLPPVWNTPAGSIGSFNELTNMIFALSATDPEGENVTFIDSTNSLPLGLLVTNNGIINGIPPQVASDQVFNFSIDAVDGSGGTTSQSFEMTVIDVDNIPPIWITTPLLGSFPEGVFAPLVLSAIDPDVGPLPTLSYVDTSGSGTHIVPGGAISGLPTGLSLSLNGIITGTASVTGDTVFSFEVTVSDGAATVPEQFLMTILEVLAIPANRSTLVVRITGDNRQEFKTWNTSDLIADGDLFEPSNPDFGRTVEPEIFVMDDIHIIVPINITTVFGLHHNTFDVLGGITQSAVVRDANDTAIYEVIYINIIDPQHGSDFEIISGTVPSALDTTGIEEFTSKNFDHLRTELQELPNSEVLPNWMRSEQIVDDETSILGYIPAIVLAFVKPGRGDAILERLNKITLTTVTLPASETTFDINTVIGTVFEPIVSLNDFLTITNGTNLAVDVNFTFPFTLTQIVQDINDAGIDGVTATAPIVELFVPDAPPATFPGEFQTGRVLSITFDQSQIAFSSTVLTELGLPNIGQETDWLDGTTFDKTDGTDVIITKGPGFQFAGRRFTIDRYLFDDNQPDITSTLEIDSNTTTFDGGTTVFDSSTGIRKWIKFSSDINSPSWITDKGVIGGFVTGDSGFVQLEVESQFGGVLSFSLIYGALPNGLTLNGTTGAISGTVLAGNSISNYFVIRVIDIVDGFDNGLVADRGFDIIIDGPVTFDNNFTTFDFTTTTFSSP